MFTAHVYAPTTSNMTRPMVAEYSNAALNLEI
jgi:hypothetical protein